MSTSQLEQILEPPPPVSGATYRSLVSSIQDEYLSDHQAFPWIIGFSGGKDSTLVAHLVIAALLDIPSSRHTRPIHVVANDTLVESPLVVAHLHESLAEIRDAAKILGLPITVATTAPNAENTFWVLLIGKGYPSPNSQMRWCTDRLKIQPTSTYIKQQVAARGSAIILLGVRRDESAARRKRIDSHSNEVDSNLQPHSDLQGAFVYRPIIDLTTDAVWDILATHVPPWGSTHDRLIKLYRDAAGGECPIVLSQEDAPGCGTNSSRFGCWTCTVVEKDKSLQGFVDSGNQRYAPLIAFRDWLKEIRNDTNLRQAERRNGRVSFNARGQHIAGPFTVQARRMILERLLTAQAEYGAQLISEAEIQVIRRLWTEDLTKT